MRKITKLIIVGIYLLAFSIVLSGCGEKEAEEIEKAQDPYEQYIHEALESVRDNAQVDDSVNTPPEVTSDNPNGRVIEFVRDDESEKEQIYISSDIDSSYEDAFEDNSDVGDSNTSSETGTDPNEKKVTPAVFDVGTGLVYIDGKYDETYRTNLLQTINDARTGLNYPPMTINNSLNTCANLRTKEIACFLSHIRPDGSRFSSLAPDYYKAEIITIDSANPKETLDAWLLDPVSRNLIFTKDFTSIGASNYICNGLNCIVVSFGY